MKRRRHWPGSWWTMTTPRDYAPVLDRLLQREVTTTFEVAGATTFAYDTERLQTGDRVPDGEWRRDSDTELAIGLNDSNGLSFPDDLTLPASGVEVAFDGAAATILTITALDVLRDPLSFIPFGIRLTFGGTLPAAGTALAITVETGGTQTVTQTVTRPVWAARRDYRGRDFLRVSETESLIGITSTRFIVRAEGPAWAIGDTFTDDKGVTQTVQGIGEIGRGRWLELLTQSTG